MTSVEEAKRTYQEVCWWEGCAWNWRMESLVQIFSESFINLTSFGFNIGGGGIGHI